MFLQKGRGVARVLIFGRFDLGGLILCKFSAAPSCAEPPSFSISQGLSLKVFVFPIAGFRIFVVFLLVLIAKCSDAEGGLGLGRFGFGSLITSALRLHRVTLRPLCFRPSGPGGKSSPFRFEVVSQSRREGLVLKLQRCCVRWKLWAFWLWRSGVNFFRFHRAPLRR